MPLDPPLTDKLRYVAGYQYEELADTDSLSRLLRLGPEWHSQLDSGWLRVVSLKWQREEYRLGDDSGLSTLLLPGIAYSYLRSDNRIDPSEGYRLQFEIAAAKDGVLSDANLVHANAQARGLTTLGRRHRFLGRVQLGGNWTDEYVNVPPSLRYFAGGDQSVRGYDYQSLSPTNSDGDRIGGRYQFAASVEYQFSLTERWRIAAFADQAMPSMIWSCRRSSRASAWACAGCRRSARFASTSRNRSTVTRVCACISRWGPSFEACGQVGDGGPVGAGVRPGGCGWLLSR